MVNQVWGKHATVVTGSQDGTKQVSKNEWNENLNRKGLLGFDAETIASASTVTIPDDTSNDVSSFIKLSGSTSVDTLATTNTDEGDLLYIITTGSVTLNNTSSPSSAGDIRLLGNANLDLSTTVPTILMRVGNFWYEYGGVTTFGAGDLTGTTLASGVVTTSVTTVGTIGSGTWQGTAVADSYVASALTWNGKQDALTFGILNTNVTKAGSGIVDDDFIRVDGTTFEGRSASEVLSDIGAQASLTFGISNGNVTKVNATVADNDFIRIDGTEQEGRSATEVLSDIGGLGTALTDTYLFVGNGSAVATGVAVSGDATLANTGALTLDSDVRAIGVQDMAVPASACWATETNGADGLTAVEAAEDQPTYQVWEFDKDTEQHIQFCVPMPRNYNNGTITATFYWTSTGSGDVVWGISGRAFSNDDALAQAFGTVVEVTDTLTAASDVCVSSETAAITLAGSPADADMWQCQIDRVVGAGGDDLNADARLLSIVIHYTTDSAVSG